MPVKNHNINAFPPPRCDQCDRDMAFRDDAAYWHCTSCVHDYERLIEHIEQQANRTEEPTR